MRAGSFRPLVCGPKVTPRQEGREWAELRGGSHPLGVGTCARTPLARARSGGHAHLRGLVSAAPSPGKELDVGQPAPWAPARLCDQCQEPPRKAPRGRACALHVGMQTPDPLGAGAAQVKWSIKGVCSFSSFLHRYRQRRQFRGVPPASQNQRNHHQWADCETEILFHLQDFPAPSCLSL